MRRGVLEYPMHLNEPVDPNDRFAYGWRYVPETRPDGSERMVQVPLTLEDILHPQEEDFRLLSDPHTRDVRYLADVFESVLSDVAGAHVLSDCRVAWDAAGKFGHGPDVAVVFNVRQYERWSTFNVIDEGTKPALIIEVTSPSTRSTDLWDKLLEYAEQGVTRYIIADAREKPDSRKITLLDYRLGEDGEYVLQPTSANGRIWMEDVQLWLGSESGNLVCYDVDGNRKGTYPELDQALRSADQKIESLDVAKKHADKKARDADKKARDADKKARVAEDARAAAEQRALDEKKLREELEARLQALEEKLKKGSSVNGHPKPI